MPLRIPMPGGISISKAIEFYQRMHHAAMEDVSVAISKLPGSEDLVFVCTDYFPSLWIRNAHSNHVQIDLQYGDNGFFEPVTRGKYDKYGFKLVIGERIYRKLSEEEVLRQVSRLIGKA